MSLTERTVMARGARGGREPAPEGAPVGAAPLPLERLALVALVLGGERAEALFEGLRTSDAARAKGHLAGFQALSSARRQARVAVEFGVRPDAAERLRRAMAEASEVLRREMFRRLAPYHRSLFPSLRLEPADGEATELVGAWAERLIREATR